MLRIGICDDEEIVVELLQKIVTECADDNAWDLEQKGYLSGDALLIDINMLDVVFLDIDMPQIDGIETGKYICKINPKCKIVMASGRIDRFKESFYINAFRFVTKPFDKEEISEVLQDVLNERIGSETIELFDNRIKYDIQQRDIMYIESYAGYSEFIVNAKIAEKSLRRSESLSELEELLPNELFYRVNRQCIVNLMWVNEYRNGNAYVHDKKIVVSRRRKKDFEYKYVTYDLKYR